MILSTLEYKYLDDSYNRTLVKYESWIQPCQSADDGVLHRILGLSKNTVNDRITKIAGPFPLSANNIPNGYVFLNSESDTLEQKPCFADFYSVHTAGLGEIFSWRSIVYNTRTKKLLGYVKVGDTTGIILPDGLLLADKEPIRFEPITIQPNISNGFYTVDFDREEPLLFDIYNVNGQFIDQIKSRPFSNQITINIQNEPAGICFLKVSTSKAFRTYKLMKE